MDPRLPDVLRTLLALLLSTAWARAAEPPAEFEFIEWTVEGGRRVCLKDWVYKPVLDEQGRVFACRRTPPKLIVRAASGKYQFVERCGAAGREVTTHSPLPGDKTCLPPGRTPATRSSDGRRTVARCGPAESAVTTNEPGMGDRLCVHDPDGSESRRFPSLCVPGKYPIVLNRPHAGATACESIAGDVHVEAPQPVPGPDLTKAKATVAKAAGGAPPPAGGAPPPPPAGGGGGSSGAGGGGGGGGGGGSSGGGGPGGGRSGGAGSGASAAAPPAEGVMIWDGERLPSRAAAVPASAPSGQAPPKPAFAGGPSPDMPVPGTPADALARARRPWPAARRGGGPDAPAVVLSRAPAPVPPTPPPSSGAPGSGPGGGGGGGGANGVVNYPSGGAAGPSASPRVPGVPTPADPVAARGSAARGQEPEARLPAGPARGGSAPHSYPEDGGARAEDAEDSFPSWRLLLRLSALTALIALLAYTPLPYLLGLSRKKERRRK